MAESENPSNRPRRTSRSRPAASSGRGRSARSRAGQRSIPLPSKPVLTERKTPAKPQPQPEEEVEVKGMEQAMENKPPVTADTPEPTVEPSTAEKAPVEKKSNLKPFWILWFLTLIAVGGSITYLVLFTSFFDGMLQGNGSDSATAQTEQTETKPAETTAPEYEEPVQEVEASDPVMSDSDAEEAETPEEMDAEPDAPAETFDEVPDDVEETIGSDVGMASDLKGSWIISLAATGSENFAQKEVDKYQAAGYENATFFYIPDLIPGGNEMYKVCLGPYASREDVTTDLASVKAMVAGAYSQLIK